MTASFLAFSEDNTRWEPIPLARQNTNSRKKERTNSTRHREKENELTHFSVQQPCRHCTVEGAQENKLNVEHVSTHFSIHRYARLVVSEITTTQLSPQKRKTKGPKRKEKDIKQQQKNETRPSSSTPPGHNLLIFFYRHVLHRSILFPPTKKKMINGHR